MCVWRLARLSLRESGHRPDRHRLDVQHLRRGPHRDAPLALPGRPERGDLDAGSSSPASDRSPGSARSSTSRVSCCTWPSLMAFGVWYLLNKTWYGLYARAAGERPLAAESGGLNVLRLRYPAVIVASVIRRARRLGPGPRHLGRLRTRHDCRSGLHRPGGGGARQMAAALDHDLCPRVRFDPGSSIPGCSSDRALQSVPTQFWVALPYLVTVMAVVFAPGSTYPAAVGIPYRRGPAPDPRLEIRRLRPRTPRV